MGLILPPWQNGGHLQRNEGAKERRRGGTEAHSSGAAERVGDLQSNLIRISSITVLFSASFRSIILGDPHHHIL